MVKEDKILVSVCVITYNSAKTVVETLNSIYNQSYQNIELVVSDDCSKDDTIEICRQWIDEHKGRFLRVELLTAEKNTGVSSNFNRAIKACRSKWVKTIAGDDVLMSHCIDEYMNYITTNPDTIIVFSEIEAFGEDKERCKQIEKLFDYAMFKKPVEQQYEYLVTNRNFVPAATEFLNKKTMSELGLYFDERIPLLEDWPMWIKMTRANIHLDFIDKTTVKYRVSETSLSTTENLSNPYLNSCHKVYIYYQFPYFYRNGDKKEAILKYLRCKKIVSSNKIFWIALLRIYKKLFIH